MDKIICVGKNYRDHALELGDAIPEKPVLFLKPPSVLVSIARLGDAATAPLPRERGAVHHECEIVVRLGFGGSNLSLEDAERAIDGWTLGLDMTLRDVQAKLKKAGHPWEIGKVFPGSAVLGPWLTGHVAETARRQSFSLRIGGTVRQTGHEGQMTLSPAECVQYASQHFPLRPGDAVFTGTPAGVGPVEPGDEAELVWGEQVLARVRWT